MEMWLQEKYILLLSNRLDRFVRKSANLFNFRCAFCGDSEKNKHIKRGYLYKRGNNYKYHCHNCGKHSNFEYVLKELDPNLYYEMVKESYGEQIHSFDEPPPALPKKIDTTNCLSSLISLKDLADTHSARKYLLSRKLPIDKIDALYYCENFKELVNSLEPGKLKTERHAIPRIIIPFFDVNNSLFGFQGRAIDPNEDIRYISIILDETKPKAYNLNQVNFNKQYYVFEGPFDSMFFENSMAVCGSDVLSVLNSIGCNKENSVIIFDNEPRNKDIVGNIAKSIMYGWTVCIWPPTWEEKDINDAIKRGMSAQQINSVIQDNIYSGTIAKLKLAQWRKDER